MSWLIEIIRLPKVISGFELSVSVLITAQPILLVPKSNPSIFSYEQQFVYETTIFYILSTISELFVYLP